MSKHAPNNLSIVEVPRDDRFSEEDKRVFAGSTVPDRYRGTAADQHDMAMLGHKQVLRRNFSFVTMLGFSSTVLVAWEILMVIGVYSLEDGGTAIIFWGLLVGVIGMIFVYASIAEMASMCPTAGGQFHYVSEFGPPRYQRQLSYAVGWLTAMGWQVFLAGTCFMVASIIQGLIALNNPDTYVPKSWHGTMFTIAVLLFATLFNTFFAKRLPLIEGALLVLHLAGLFAIAIPLWVLAPRGTVHETIFTFTTTGGWSSVGLASLIGMLNPIAIFVGYDCSVHMSEEVEDSSATVPKALIWSVVSNGIMALIMGTTFIFCIGDLNEVLDSATGEPFIQVFYNATQSYAGATIMSSIVAIMITSACISEVATASRQLWAFARDNGLPCSSWLAEVTPGWNLPLRAVFVSIVITTLLSLINLGSVVALNAISSLGVLSILFSYTITLSCLIWRRLFGAPLPQRRWTLGRYGLAVNIIALCFILPLLFFDAWPLVKAVTPANFNWSSVMFVSILLIALIHYIVYARHVYTGPVLQVKRDE